MRVSNRLSSVAASAALLASSPVIAGEADANHGWRQVAYNCESGNLLTVAFRESGSSVRVIGADNQAVRLNVRPARSGFRFSDSRPERLSDTRYELRGEDDALTWRINSRNPIKCTSEDPAAANLAAAATR